MKFRFRLETLMKQRKVEQDLAQRDFAIASENLRQQLALIKSMYDELDRADEMIEGMQREGGKRLPDIQQIHEFKNGQKVKIQRAREKARELMTIEEEKLEVLTEKLKAHKILEKLKEKKQIEFKKEKQKKTNKQIDDLVTSRYQFKR